MSKIIIANWKLNPITVVDAKKLANSIKKKSPNIVVLCPPTIFLTQIKYPILGAQDCFWMSKGAFTGQTSPLMLKALQIQYCLVGHSERRAAGESDEQVNLKVKALLDNKITPVICVGYGTTVEQDDLEVVDIIKEQLAEALDGVNTKKVIVAYEPVWSISAGDPYATKKMATPEHAEKIAIFIRNKFGVKKVLYGGSINSANADSFLKQRNIDGLLVGGASLIPEDFNKIIAL